MSFVIRICMVVLFMPFSFKSALLAQSNNNAIGYGGNVYPLENVHQIIALSDQELSSAIIHLPYQEDELMSFYVYSNSLLTHAAASSMGNIRSYDIHSISHQNIHGKLIISNEYILSTVLSDEGIFTYQSSNCGLNSQDSFKALTRAKCEHSGIRGKKPRQGMQRSADNISNGTTLREFNIAIAATGEFYVNNGSNLTLSQAIIANAVNSWNLIYEKDLAIRFNLLPPVVFTDPGTDPFTGDLVGGAPRPVQAAEVIAANFSISSYDIGHVFHNTSGSTDWTDGGIAGVATACNNSTSTFSGTGPLKAANWSGASNNVNTAFISLSAHEMGHPLGAEHTFNGLGNSCDVNSIAENNAYEIGSGTTLMAYNGLCSPDQNIPSGGEDDLYFHSVSIDQILTYVSGLSCDSETATGNSIPECSAQLPGVNYSIPQGTPFELSGLATDADGDNLLYTWEQIDEDGTGTLTMGKIGNAAAIDPAAPLFRSISPQESPNRTFPDITNILNGNNNGDDFEALPMTERTMKFVFVVRDCNPNGGGVCTSPVNVTVLDDFIGSFEITSQNTEESWVANGSNMATITWDADFTFFDCDKIDILFSTDGGFTFPHVLASEIDNDLETINILIPHLPTGQGRIKLKCSDGIFFDINNANINISSSCSANAVEILPSNNVEEFEGSPNLDLVLNPNFGAPIGAITGTLSSADPTSSLSFNDGGSCGGPGNPVLYDSFEVQAGTNGVYTFSFLGGANGKVAHLYDQPYDPLNVCNGWLASSAELVSPTLIDDNDSFSYSLVADIPYFIVITSFDDYPQIPIIPQPYTLNISGGNLFDGVPNPVGFTFSYVIVNSDTQLIVEISSDPDLSSATTYPAGDYEIYGLSWDGVGSLPSPGTAFSNLQSDIVDLTLCAQLSSNTIGVTILEPPCPAPDDTDGDGVCDVDDICPGFDDNEDEDADSIPDGCDLCLGNNASGDTDSDGICDDIDPLPNPGCDIFEDIVLTNVNPCNNNGTTNTPDDDFFLTDVTVIFQDAIGEELVIKQYQNISPFNQIIIASQLISNLDSPTQHTFLSVPLNADGSGIFLEIDFIDASGNETGCGTFVFDSFQVPDCSCEEIFIEFISVTCVDPNNTPNDPTDDEIEYVFIANKGTAGMGSSSSGEYGLANDCDQGGETEYECDEITGEFNEPTTAVTNTEAGKNGGSRSFTFSYDDGCTYTVEFPYFDEFPELDPNTIVTPCDDCIDDPNKLLAGECGCGNLEPGSACDDGNPLTTFDEIQADCTCAGLPFSEGVEIIDPCECLDNASNQVNGQFSEVIQIESNGPGEEWYIVSGTGFYDVASNPPPSGPIPYIFGSTGIIFNDGNTDGIDNDMDSQIDESDEDHYYTLPGIHIEGIGYELTVSNGSETLLVSNKCYYPNIQINIPTLLSEDDLPLTLGDHILGITLPSGLPASGTFTFSLCSFNGDPIPGLENITEIPTGLDPNPNYLLKIGFEEDEIPVTTPPTDGIPGCLQEIDFLFKIVEPGCNN